MKHVMIDTETAGSTPGSAILTIAAVAFDPFGAPVTNRQWHDDDGHFYCKVQLQSCIDQGLSVDGSTISWWMGQSDQARDEVFGSDGRLTIGAALDGLRYWYQKVSDQERLDDHSRLPVWSHGASFDIPILEVAYRRVRHGIPPWRYSAIRDTRTIFWLADLQYQDLMTPMIEHHALHDALTQCANVQMAIKRIPGVLALRNEEAPE